jgi:hypothetical protein
MRLADSVQPRTGRRVMRRPRVREPPRSTVEEGSSPDISGCTGYLVHSELDNAPEFVPDLLETVIGHFDPILRLAKLEGDAAFVYAIDSMLDGSGLMEIVEGAYFAFRRRVRDLEHASSCGCGACARMPDLDLKTCVHHGRFVRQQVAGSEELTQTAVSPSMRADQPLVEGGEARDGDRDEGVRRTGRMGPGAAPS